MRFLNSLLLVINFILFFVVSGNAQAQKIAAWVVRFDIDTPEKVDAICRQADEHRFDRLLVQVRGRADAYYKSDLVPRAENIALDFDPLAAVLSKCKNVEVDAWLNVFYLWTGETPPEDERHPALTTPWVIKDHQGRRVDAYSTLEQSQRWIEGIYADPASDEYRQYFADAVVELVQNYPVRGIHLDFVRYPGSFFGAGGRLAQEFEQEFGLAVYDLPVKLSRQDFAGWLNGSLTSDRQRLVTARLIWDYRRAKEVSKLVSMVRSALLVARPDVRLSVSVFPDPVEAFLDKGQDWPGWLAAGIIDELFIMNYFGDKIRVRSLYDEVVKVVGSADKLWLGLGTYIKEPQEILEEVALCGADGQATCFFSLGHVLNQRKSVRAYVDAVRNHPDPGPVVYSSKSVSPLAAGLSHLKECLAAYDTVSCHDYDHAFLSLDEGQRQRSSGDRIGNGPWVDLRGIFRYVNPYDGLARVEEQLALARQSYELLVGGESFQEVAREFSQAGSRHQGGLLPRRYLRRESRIDQLLAELEPGQFSPVIPVDNGFWVYQILSKGKP